MRTNVKLLVPGPTRSGPRSSVPWMLGGALAFLALLVFTWRFHRDPVEERALKAARLAAVEQMRIALASASEAEKSSVLAVTDVDSERLAAEARRGLALVEAARARVAELLTTGSPEERASLGAFDARFATMRPVAEEVLRLSVQNTNLKAYAATFGPAADALADFDACLARVGDRRSTLEDVRRAYEARLGLQRIQTLLPPHIAEESDAKMDRLERRMSREEERVRGALDALRGAYAGDPDLDRAAADLARYAEYKQRILALSRENTNVRSMELSLHELRKAMLACVEALAQLERAIERESVPGEGQTPVLPR